MIDNVYEINSNGCLFLISLSDVAAVEIKEKGSMGDPTTICKILFSAGREAQIPAEESSNFIAAWKKFKNYHAS